MKIEDKSIELMKKLIYTVVGFTLLIIGFALLFLPGPGILIIIAGLFFLAAEFVWARRAMNELKREFNIAKKKVGY